MRTRCQHAERWTAHDQLRLADTDEIGEVGGAVRELLDDELAGDARYVLTQVRLEAIPWLIFPWRTSVNSTSCVSAGGDA